VQRSRLSRRPALLRHLHNHPATPHLRAAIHACISSCCDFALANIAWSQTIIPLGPPNLPGLLLSALHAGPLPHNGRTVALVLRLSALADIPPKPQLVSAAVDVAVDHGLSDWQDQSLSMFAWAAVQLGMFRKRTLFRAIASEAARRAPHLSMRDLALITWSLVKANRGQLAPAAEFFSKAADRVVSRQPAHAEHQGSVESTSARSSNTKHLGEDTQGLHLHIGRPVRHRARRMGGFVLHRHPNTELTPGIDSMHESSLSHAHRASAAALHGSPSKLSQDIQQTVQNAGLSWLSNEDRSQLLWAFAAEAGRRLQHRGTTEALGRLSKQDKRSLLRQVWPDVPVLEVLTRLLGAPLFSVEQQNVRTP
jgi:hypothetical protein